VPCARIRPGDAAGAEPQSIDTAPVASGRTLGPCLLWAPEAANIPRILAGVPRSRRGWDSNPRSPREGQPCRPHLADWSGAVPDAGLEPIEVFDTPDLKRQRPCSPVAIGPSAVRPLRTSSEYSRHRSVRRRHFRRVPGSPCSMNCNMRAACDAYLVRRPTHVAALPVPPLWCRWSWRWLGRGGLPCPLAERVRLRGRLIRTPAAGHATASPARRHGRGRSTVASSKRLRRSETTAAGHPRQSRSTPTSPAAGHVERHR